MASGVLTQLATHGSRTARQLWDAADPHRAVYPGEEASRRTAQEQHAALPRAAEQRVTERAVKILDGHRQQTIDRLRGSLGTPAHQA